MECAHVSHENYKRREQVVRMAKATQVMKNKM